MRKVLLLTMAAIIVIALAACGGGKNYDAQSLCDIKLSGFDGYATANLMNNQLFIKSICDNISSEDGYQTAATYALFFDTLRYQVTSDKTEGLSNGDKLQIELVSYNKDAAKELKISFNNTKFTYTVEGLVVGTVIDPFEGLKLEFSGISPKKGKIDLNILDCPDSVQSSGNFTVTPRDKVSNGDTVVVQYQYNEKTAEQNAIMFSQDKKEFVVDGLAIFPTSLQGVNLSDTSNLLQMQLQKSIEKDNSGKDWTFITTFGDRRSEWSLENDFVVEKSFFHVNKENVADNAIVVIYKVHTKGIVTKSGGSSVPENTEKESTEYFIITMNGIYVLDNAIVINEDTNASYYTKDTNLDNIIKKANAWIGNSQAEEINLG